MKAPPRPILPILERLKSVYLLWYGYYQILPKTHRHSLGQRIDSLFIEIIEAAAYGAFLQPEEKLPYLRHAIQKLDALKKYYLLFFGKQNHSILKNMSLFLSQ